MDITAWLAAVGGLGALILAGLVWYYRREAAQETTERDRAVADLATAQRAAAGESARQQEVMNVDADFFEAYQSAVERMVSGHPDLAREYAALVLRFAAGAPGPADAPVPRPAAPGLPAGGGQPGH